MKIGYFSCHTRWVAAGRTVRTSLLIPPMSWNNKVYRGIEKITPQYPPSTALKISHITAENCHPLGMQGFQMLVAPVEESIEEALPFEAFDLYVMLPSIGGHIALYDHDLKEVKIGDLSTWLGNKNIYISKASLNIWYDQGAELFCRKLTIELDKQTGSSEYQTCDSINWFVAGVISAKASLKAPVTKWVLKGGKIEFPKQEDPKPEPEPSYTGSKPQVDWASFVEPSPENPVSPFLKAYDDSQALAQAHLDLKIKLQAKLAEEKAKAQAATPYFPKPTEAYKVSKKPTPKKFSMQKPSSYQDLSKAWEQKTKVE